VVHLRLQRRAGGPLRLPAGRGGRGRQHHLSQRLLRPRELLSRQVRLHRRLPGRGLLQE